MDALQHQTNEGPCLDAIADRLIVYAHDLDKDLRWRHFAPQATRPAYAACSPSHSRRTPSTRGTPVKC